MAAGRTSVAGTASDPNPELVVVFDLVGTADQFARAVARIPGLEFLTEVGEEAAEPDDDFYLADRKGRVQGSVAESLHMVMANVQAVTELISLFHRWQANPTGSFDRGLNPLRSAFALMRDVRRWGPEDRVRETGLLESWRETVELIGASQSSVRVEIELWYRTDADRRSAAQAGVATLVQAAGGEIAHTAVLEAIGYHAMLVDLPHREVEAVLARGPEAIGLLTADEVMFVAPAQPMTIPGTEPSDVPVPDIASGTASAPPVVALLDGVPLTNHATLVGRLLVDDPDDIASRYTSNRQRHGTAMASLIAHGDLTNPGEPLTTRIYVRPIFEPHPSDSTAETVMQGELLVDLIHRAFVRMFEGDRTRPPAAPSARIVNLSVGDPARVFVRQMSPLAKLLDWLAHRYNLLIVVSAGNHPTDTTVPATAVADSTALHNALLVDARARSLHRRLLAPAEAVNVLTVGALHDDSWSGDLPDTVLNGIEAGVPALYSAVGAGYRRAVKPEILMPGGRSLFQRPPASNTTTVALRSARSVARGPGVLVAAPGMTGEPTATAYLSGTSNAAALGSRVAHQIIEVLTGLTPDADDFAFPDPQYHPVLTKTLLVHAADWGRLKNRLSDALRLEQVAARRNLTQLIGYGPVDPTRAAAATRTRVVLLGAGSIAKDERHRFIFPLPPALATTAEWRRLTITLGWLSPINPRTQRYRMARLTFQPPQTEVGVKRTQADHSSVVRGTLQHEILEGETAVAFASGEGLAIDVDCRIDVGRLTAPVRYGLAVSVEMAATVSADLHAQVREQLRTQLQQRSTTQIASRVRP